MVGESFPTLRNLRSYVVKSSSSRLGSCSRCLPGTVVSTLAVRCKMASVSSDTESAAGGARTARSERSRLSALSARVRAALPRAKDKVKDAEQPQDAEEKLAEEKKGVVYAELALGEQNQGDKPPPPAAEYAEIVYTDQQKETKE